ncbi:MAG: HAD-IA family hydrolase [Caulobacteraceae bacterium]|nr:HAD-IA family hydrolase [Caulobacteraceae bacterium]
MSSAKGNQSGVDLDRSPSFDVLVFDLGGVVVAHDDAALHARLISRCPLGADLARLEAVVREPRWALGEAPIEDLHARLRREFGYGLEWAGFAQDWRSHFTLDVSMLALLRSLGRSRRVLLFSNTNKEHWNYLVEASEGVLANFEHYLSHEIGLLKPSVAAFAHVAERSGVSPSRMMFFDDLPVNVAGARLAGYQAEVFRDEASLRSFLKAHGVCWK